MISMKKFLSLCIVVSMVFMTISMTMTPVLATSTTTSSTSTGSAGASGAAGNIYSSGVIILRALMWFGYAVAIGMVLFIGIKYMLGAADSKANMKSAITGWLIGALIVFMASSIVAWVISATSPGGNVSGSAIVNALK